MGKNEKTPIIIDDVEYQYEDMTAGEFLTERLIELGLKKA